MQALGTARLVLEPLTAAHAEALFEPLSDPRLYAFIAEDPPASLEALRARYRRLERRASPDGAEAWLNWAVLSRDDGRALGYVQAGVAAGVATIAYMLAPPAQGRGYAREAVAAAIDHLAAGGVARFRACVDTRNARSIALLAALGFTRAALRPGAEWIHGVLTDEAEYQLAR